GQTSAWYVFSALGFYPVTPASEQYVLGTPLFTKATIQLDNGKQIVINAPNSSDKNIYVNNLLMNGKKHDLNWLNHFELMKGAVLNYNMSASPNKLRGTGKAAYPFSMSK
ncbi:MAG: glycoside hydrolase family 92 protein, partial [Sphingobacteriales bacterium]